MISKNYEEESEVRAQADHTRRIQRDESRQGFLLKLLGVTGTALSYCVDKSLDFHKTVLDWEAKLVEVNPEVGKFAIESAYKYAELVERNWFELNKLSYQVFEKCSLATFEILGTVAEKLPFEKLGFENLIPSRRQPANVEQFMRELEALRSAARESQSVVDKVAAAVMPQPPAAGVKLS